MDNPPDARPVFEADQVVTIYDLIGVRNGYIHQYQATPWFRFSRRFQFLVGVGVCNEMLHWLSHGKPYGGVKCGGHNAV
jgi:hypothetical protein